MFSKNVERSLCPVRAPVQRIQFDARIPYPFRQLICERRFARASRADDGDPLADRAFVV
jgi:hypothetical protein